MKYGSNYVVAISLCLVVFSGACVEEEILDDYGIVTHEAQEALEVTPQHTCDSLGDNWIPGGFVQGEQVCCTAVWQNNAKPQYTCGVGETCVMGDRNPDFVNGSQDKGPGFWGGGNVIETIVDLPAIEAVWSSDTPVEVVNRGVYVRENEGVSPGQVRKVQGYRSTRVEVQVACKFVDGSSIPSDDACGRQVCPSPQVKYHIQSYLGPQMVSGEHDTNESAIAFVENQVEIERVVSSDLESGISDIGFKHGWSTKCGSEGTTQSSGASTSVELGAEFSATGWKFGGKSSSTWSAGNAWAGPTLGKCSVGGDVSGSKQKSEELTHTTKGRCTSTAVVATTFDNRVFVAKESTATLPRSGSPGDWAESGAGILQGTEAARPGGPPRAGRLLCRPRIVS